METTSGAPGSSSHAGHSPPRCGTNPVLRARRDATDRQRGAFLIIAAVFMLIVLAFLGVVFLTTFTTSTLIALNEVQATRAFAAAEGGLAYHQRDLALNLNWYLSTADPLLTTTGKALGSGSFDAATTLPATLLRTRMCDPALPSCIPPPAIRAYTTNRFPTAGFLQIEDDITGSAEFVQYAGIAADTFTGITRNVAIGGIAGTAGSHARGSRVYPVTTLVDAMPNTCATILALQVAVHTKFLGGGTLDVEGEEISYAGSSSAGGVLTLQGVQRCRNSTCVCPAAPAHAPGVPVTPLLAEGTSPDFEAEVVSAGTVGEAVRTTRKIAQR